MSKTPAAQAAAATAAEPAPAPAPAAPASEAGALIRAEQPRILDKFASVDELAKAYVELERRLGSAQQQPPAQPEPAQQQPTEPAQQQPTEQSEVEDVLARAGLKYSDLEQEFLANGDLSEATVEKLVRSGIPSELIVRHVDAVRAAAAAEQERMFAPYGGVERVNEALDWAAQNLDPSSIAALNASFDSGDAGRVKLALDAVMAKFGEAAPAAPNLVLATGQQGAVAAAGYVTKAELVAAVNDPRYGRDPDYTAQHERRLARTDLHSLR